MNIYDFSVKDNHGQERSLGAYRGKVLLVVNTATRCGLTPQYEALEATYKKYKDRGFEVLDFPCNQFREQAPETDDEIAQFCSVNYGTTFPRFAKVEINGQAADPLFVWLKQEGGEAVADDDARAFEKKVLAIQPIEHEDDIVWNFGKFLIDREGNVHARYSPAYKPSQVEADIEKLL